MTTHPADVVRRLFERMEARDWAGAGEVVAPGAVIEWPATGERFTGTGFVAMNAAYPEGWSITVDDVVGTGDRVAALVTVAHPPEVHRCAGFYTVWDGRISGGVELWVTASSEDPPAWRQPHRSP